MRPMASRPMCANWEGIIVAEFNRHQASVLLQQSLTAVVETASDNHRSVQRNLSKLVSQSTDRRS